MNYHNPVLAQVAIDWLEVQPGEKYIDATLGAGGHASEIICRGGSVLGLDQDPEALRACPDLEGLVKVQTNFIHLDEVARKYHWIPVAGILFDLGVSQHQVETPQRGFSFQLSGPLDMRMGPSTALRAAELVNLLSVNQLTSLLKDYGEIPVAKTLASKIVAARPLTTTSQLAKVSGRRWSRQAFQALRIAVNDELGALATALPQAMSLLKLGGRLVVISFHSLEDRLVKQQFVRWQTAGQGKTLTPKPILGERGSKLRAFLKT